MTWIAPHLTAAARVESANAEAAAAARHGRLARTRVPARRQDAADDAAERASDLEAARRRGIEAAAAVTGTDADALAEVVRRRSARSRVRTRAGGGIAHGGLHHAHRFE